MTVSLCFTIPSSAYCIVDKADLKVCSDHIGIFIGSSRMSSAVGCLSASHSFWAARRGFIRARCSCQLFFFGLQSSIICWISVPRFEWWDYLFDPATFLKKFFFHPFQFCFFLFFLLVTCDSWILRRCRGYDHVTCTSWRQAPWPTHRILGLKCFTPRDQKSGPCVSWVRSLAIKDGTSVRWTLTPRSTSHSYSPSKVRISWVPVSLCCPRLVL
jgi:hypothetical protein